MKIFASIGFALLLAAAPTAAFSKAAAPSVIAFCGDGYYENSRGACVPRPRRTPDNRPPAGATAQCRDGTWSFSQSRRGTCSHHGGVRRWLG